MKGRSLLGFMVSLTVLGTSLLSRPQIAVAEPASIFKPILRNIQNQLPRGMVMRLPAFIPSRVKLYALVYSDSSGIIVKLGSERNCNYHACSMGGLSVSRRDSSESQWLSDAKRKGTSITLKKGIIGFYTTTFSMSDGERRYVTWEQDGMIFSVNSRLMSRQEVIDAAISMANEPPIYDIVTANSQIATGRSPSPLQTYRDTRALGMAQFLQEKQELISAQDKLQHAAKEQYDIVEIPSTDFLTNPFTNVAESPGTLFGKRKDVSYADYLKLKLKLKAQETIFNDGVSIVKAIEPYNEKLNKENRQGGREVSQRISSNFNNYWSRVQEQNQEPSLSLENLARRLSYAIEETRISDINLITGGVQTGGKLASAFTDLGGLVKLLNLPELTNPESFQRVGLSLDYVFTVKEKLEDIKDAFLKGNNEKVNDINLEIASETIKLIDAPEVKSIRTAEAIAIRSEAMNLIERHKFLQQSQLTEVLDGFDKIYLTTAQVSSAIKIVTSTLAFIAPGKQVVRTFADKADAVNALLFNALQFSYKDAVRRQYERLGAYSNRNQQMISGLSSSIDFSAQEIGQYLIRTRTDVVTRRPDGSIAVSVKGVVSPP